MCPDAELISAYADGEVPSPWRERLAEHLESCPGCAERLGAFVELGTRLSSAGGGEEQALVERVSTRLAARLAPRFAALQASPRQPLGSSLGRLARRSVSLPLPLAAAAALVLVFFTGLGMSALLRPAAAPVASVAAAEIAPSGAQGASMEALLSYLQAQDAQLNLTIHLPQSATYASTGSPLIVTAPALAYSPYPAAIEDPAPLEALPSASPDSATEPAAEAGAAKGEAP